MKNTTSPIHFAVVGMGHIGRRHASMIREHRDCSLVAVCDNNVELHADLANDFGVPVYADLSELLEKEQVDVLNVCTPNGLHAPHALTGLRARAHVVVEKPMGLNRQQCEEVIYEALHQSRNVFVVMQNRYSPPAVWLKSLIEEKRFGEVYMVQVNCYWNRGAAYYNKSNWKGTLALDGGPLFTQFSHFLDIMYWLFGDITNIQSKFSNNNHLDTTEFEDSGIVSFDFVRGGIGVLNYSTSVAQANFESSITIIGEHGTVKVGGQYMDQIETCTIPGLENPVIEKSAPPNDYGDYKGSAANHHFTIQNVIDTFRGQSAISTNALEGMKVVEIIERIYARRPEFPPLTSSKS